MKVSGNVVLALWVLATFGAFYMFFFSALAYAEMGTTVEMVVFIVAAVVSCFLCFDIVRRPGRLLEKFGICLATAPLFLTLVVGFLNNISWLSRPR